MKHFFFLVMNTRTYETYFGHAGADAPEELKQYAGEDEKILMAWEASPEAFHFD